MKKETIEQTEAQKITAWIKGHEYFKWSSMCAAIGVDFGNFHRTIHSPNPVIKPETIVKIVGVLKDYGYNSYSFENTGIIIPQSVSGKANEKFKESAPVIVYKKASKKSFDGGENAKKKLKDINKLSGKMVHIEDLTKPTGKKVVSDPPPKENFSIDSTKSNKGKGKESPYLAARRKLKQ